MIRPTEYVIMVKFSDTYTGADAVAQFVER